MSVVDEEARAFLRVAHLYQLGNLVTEGRHELTADLSAWAKRDLPRAYRALTAVDRGALLALGNAAPAIAALGASLRSTLAEGGRVFICGCGATGRLALLLESLWREKHGADDDRVCAFMAGGDVALVHSLEGFEDHPGHGARHLRDLGFDEGDTLVACSEGGETPYVLGAVEEAARRQRRPPYFLYCNPDDALADIPRSRGIIERPDVRKVNLSVGPMALSGSTRMQASTVLQLAVGYALLTTHDAFAIAGRVAAIADALATGTAAHLQPFTEREAEIYASGGFVLYSAEACPITVFTDATERAPTFSLPPMSHHSVDSRRASSPSLSYVTLPAAASAGDAWRTLLGRGPRALDWPDVDGRTTRAYLEAFDFGAGARGFRERQLRGASQETFRIAGPGIAFEFSGLEWDVGVPSSWELLERHTLLKVLLNQHSTLVMGRLGRYERNIMTWVAPANGKLIDRATRYARHLLGDRGISCSYEMVVFELFRQRALAAADESVVMRVVESLSSGV
jgi:N-acetylmuramic acid 6-phosphate etherase